MEFTKNRIKIILSTLEELCWKKTVPLTEVKRSPGDYSFGKTFRKEDFSWEEYRADQTWGGTDKHYWFLAYAGTSHGMLGQPLLAVLGTGADDIWNTDNPQILAYCNGQLTATMDMNHQEMLLTDCLKEGDVFELAFYAYSNSPWESNFFHLKTAVPDEEVIGLYYDMKVVYEAAELLEDEDLECQEAIEVLNTCVNLLDLRQTGSPEFYASVRQAREYINKEYYDKRPESPVTVHSIGHTHIDVAWKWPLRQTRQKTVRSFQTVLNLMDRYPEYKFMSSQPQLYQFVKEEAPWIFEKIKEKVKEGRWEAEGAMWLEPDCNLSSGESLVRHVLYGTRFFEEELGAAPNEVLWLPDVFGYSAALPQIMRQFGLKYFMTTKLGWNDHNQFPYDTFTWQGIDGSQVLTHLITTKNYDKGKRQMGRAAFNTTYNGLQNPSQIMGTWQRYQNKQVSRDLLTCYGYGDGGGGPTAQMLEQDRRLAKSVARCPKTEQTFVKDFFHILERNLNGKYLPVWNGELYLEYHRGTYTSIAENKKNNRKCEFLNQDAEFFSVLAGDRTAYPAGELEENWKLLLLNQFHDILPGSSIKDVYEDSDKQYAQIRNSDEKIISEAMKTMADMVHEEGAEKGIVLWNTLSFHRTSLLALDEPVSVKAVSQKGADGRYYYLVDAPAKGMEVLAGGVKETEERPSVLSQIRTDETGRPTGFRTPFYQVEFAGNGEFDRIVDLEEERSLLQNGRRGNQIRVFEDRPLEFDAWNIEEYYREKSWSFDDVQAFEILENGPVRGCVYLKRQFMESTLEQYIYFYAHTKRIDFKTILDWRQHQLLVKAEFPVDILANEATYEIQFGNVKRPTHKNTTWDQARFEVCAHKWADLSEAGYGVALLNDCRYGYDIHDSVMGLTLLKSGIFPNPDADQGVHEFTYSLYPHQGDFRTGSVIREAYDLNCPLYGMTEQTGQKKTYSFLTIGEENVLAETVKQAEDGQGIIVRLYEAWGKRTRVHAAFDEPWKIEECDLAEKAGRILAENEKTAVFEIKPYEIKTLRLSRSKKGE